MQAVLQVKHGMTTRQLVCCLSSIPVLKMTKKTGQLAWRVPDAESACLATNTNLKFVKYNTPRVDHLSSKSTA